MEICKPTHRDIADRNTRNDFRAFPNISRESYISGRSIFTRIMSRINTDGTVDFGNGDKRTCERFDLLQLQSEQLKELQIAMAGTLYRMIRDVYWLAELGDSTSIRTRERVEPHLALE